MEKKWTLAKIAERRKEGSAPRARIRNYHQQRFLWSLDPAAPEQDRFAKRIFFSFILLERSSILLPQASSEALFSLISVLIRVIRGLEQNTQKPTIIISKSLCSLLSSVVS